MKKVISLAALFVLISSNLFAQITGSGTTGYVPKFNTSTSIGNSSIFQTTTGNINVGGYMYNPLEKFTVNQTMGLMNEESVFKFTNPYGQLNIEHYSADIPGSTTNVMTLKSNGNVGIGTTSPTYKLHVNGSFSASSIYLGSSPVISSQWTSASGNIYFNTGNVGIGTTTLTHKLNVNGTIGANYLQVNAADNLEGGEIALVGGGTNPTWYVDVYSNMFRLHSAGSTHFSVNSAGNVGIGTTSPGTFKLAVEGKIGAREIVVQTGAWADFVFADNYKLMPLHELEKSIKSNKHLPGIPSEKDVLTNGVSLGEMQAKLLQKVEELTLYVIDLKKENDQLKKQMDQLTK